MKLELDLDWELSDAIVTKALSDLLDTLETDYASRKQGTGMAIFERDKDKDLKQLKKHIKAFKTVLKYYTGKDL